MVYTPRKTVYRLVREQLHLNKAELWRLKFPYLEQQELCLACQPFVSSCRFYWLRVTGQNIRYSGENCVLGPSKSIRYSEVCFHIFYCNSAGLSNVVRNNGVFVIAGFVIARCHCSSRTIIVCQNGFKFYCGVLRWISFILNSLIRWTSKRDNFIFQRQHL